MKTERSVDGIQPLTNGWSIVIYWLKGTCEVPDEIGAALVAAGLAQGGSITDPGLLSGSGLPAVVEDATPQPFGQPIVVDEPEEKPRRSRR